MNAGPAKKLRLPDGSAPPKLDQYGNRRDGKPARKLVHELPPPPPFEGAPVEDPEDQPQPDSGLSELDPGHIIASVLGSTLGRPLAVIGICMISFGLTESCALASGVGDVWGTGGIKGLIQSALSAPMSIFAAPLRWTKFLIGGLTEPLGVPYLMLVLGGIIFAIRTEIDLAKMAFFFAIATAIHAAIVFKITHPLSVLLFLIVIWGYIAAYAWYRRQQARVEDD